MSQEPPSRFNPFPGLRPFLTDEDYLFFGREEQTTELLGRLRRNHFIAVVGTSGSGKSSLVRAGMLPALHGGTMTAAGSFWEVLVMRPGGDPLSNLAQAFLDADLYDAGDEESLSRIKATLSRSRTGLVEAVAQAGVGEKTNVLVVVDQFEELFRFRQRGVDFEEEAGAFANLLLTASQQRNQPIYITITMRSDYLGDCSQIPGLAEAVNDGEYLIPRLTRSQRRDAIEKPVSVGRGQISKRLVQKLLNDVGDDTDQLPILQHALMRTWNYWADRGSGSKPDAPASPIDLEDYAAIGGMHTALSLHADEVYNELASNHLKAIAEKLFKALTERGPDNRGIRRPTRFHRLGEIIDADAKDLAEVIDAFRKPGRTFLMPTSETPLAPETVIDISHESLMRVWKRLDRWVEEESQSARIYKRLADTAELHAEGKAGLYHDPDLEIALTWREANQPTPAWADRYHPGFEAAIQFLVQSAEAKNAEQRAREAARKKELEQAKALAEEQRLRAEEQQRSAARLRWLVRGLGLVAMIALAALVFALTAKKEAQHNAEQARLNQDQANAQAELARRSAARAATLLDQFKVEEGRSWLARAEAYQTQKNPFYARLMAARATAFAGFGREAQSAAFQEAYPLLLKPNSPEWDKVNAIFKDTMGVSLLWQTPLNFLHEAPISCIAYRPDGAWFATASGSLSQESGGSDTSIRIWETETGDLLATIRGHKDRIEDLKFASDGDRVISVSRDGKVQVTEIPSGRVVRTFESGSRGDWQVNHFLSPHGKFLAWTRPDHDIQLFSVETGETLSTLSGHTDVVLNVAFSPNGDLIASSSMDNLIRFWAPVSGEPQGEPLAIEGSLQAILGLSFSPDGQKLAFGLITPGTTLAETSTQVWNIQTRQKLFELPGHRLAVPCTTFSNDSKLLATAGADNQLFIWNAENGSRIQSLLWERGEGPNSTPQLAFHPDHDRLSVVDVNSVRHFRVSTGKWIHERPGHSGPVEALALSADGRILATASADHTIQLWDMIEGKSLGTLHGHRGGIRDLSISPDGKWLVSGGEMDQVILWDLSARNAKYDLGEWNGISVNSVSIRPDGPQFAAGTNRGRILVWNASTGELIMDFFSGARGTRTIQYSPDGRILASGHADNKVILWDTESWEPLHQLTEHEAMVNRVVFSPDGALLASSDQIGIIRLWDVAQAKLLETMTAHDAPVWALDFSPDGGTLYSGDINGNLRAWRLPGGEMLLSMKAHEGWLNDLVTAPDNQMVVTAGEDGVARTWKITGAQQGLQFVLKGHSNAIEHLEYNSDGTLLASASDDATVRLWHPKSGTLLKTMVGHEQVIWSLHFSPDKRWIASSGRDDYVLIHDVDTGEQIHTLPIEQGGGSGSVCFSPDSQWLAFHDGNAIALWNTQTWQKDPQRSLVIPTNRVVHSIRFSPDGTLLAAGMRDGVRIWSFHSGKLERFLPGQDGAVLKVDFSPNGGKLASGSAAGTVRIRDVATGNQLLVLESGPVTHALRFHPNGSLLAGGSQSGVVRIWEVESGEVIATFQAHQGLLTSLTFDPSGTRLATGAYRENQVKIWNVAKLIRNIENPPMAPYMDWARLDGSQVRWSQTTPKLYASRKSPRFQSNRGTYLGDLESGNVEGLFERFWKAQNWKAAGGVIPEIKSETARLDAIEQLALGLIRTATDRLDQDRPRGARALIEQALKLEPDRAEFIYLLARAQWKLGDLDNALQSIDRAIHSKPESHEYLHIQGQILAAAGRNEAALQAYSQAIDLARDASVEFPKEYLMSRARLLRRMGQTEQADYDEALARGIPPRDPDADPGLIDLTLFYNAAFEDEWHNTTGNNLAQLLPGGIKELAGVRWDARGIIQLASQRTSSDQLLLHYPDKVSYIPVGIKGKAVHFLHSAGWDFQQPAGLVIANYIVHYQDGTTETIPVRIGKDVRDWWYSHSANPNPDDTFTVAWTGQNDASGRLANSGIRLYKTTWKNPHPEKEIKSIDLVSTMEEPAAFVVAITVE